MSIRKNMKYLEENGLQRASDENWKDFEDEFSGTGTKQQFAFKAAFETACLWASKKFALRNKGEKEIVYLDMDGVLADWCGAAGVVPNPNHKKYPEIALHDGFYRDLPLIKGAADAVPYLLTFKGIDLWVATKATRRNYNCASEKLFWLEEHFPMLASRAFIVPDKGHLNGSFLIDDYKERWEPKFNGTFIHFDESNPIDSWNKVFETLEEYK